MAKERKPLELKPETGWEKARPYVLGIGLPVLAALVIITVAFLLFSEKSPYIRARRTSILEEMPEAAVTSETTATGTGTQATERTVSRAVSVDTTGMYGGGTDTIRVVTTQETPESAVVSTVDTAATRKKAEERLAEEIKKMRDMYHERRTALLNEAVGFLQGNHTERAVKAKAQNFRELGDKLMQDIGKFGKPSSEAEVKLWDAQKEELRKSANFCYQLGDRISATQADERRMKIAASQLQAAGAP